MAMTELEIETVALAIFRQFCRTIRRKLRERGDDQAWRRRWDQANAQVREDFKAEARVAIAALDFLRSSSSCEQTNK
jgi:hypothetical protein